MRNQLRDRQAAQFFTGFADVYVRAIFDDCTDSLEMPHQLPELHSPLTFSGVLTSFQDGEAIVQIKDHSHFRSD